MAKPASVLIKMVSTADTGYFYVKKKNTRTSTEKLEMRKYDPVAQRIGVNIKLRCPVASTATGSATYAFTICIELGFVQGAISQPLVHYFGVGNVLTLARKRIERPWRLASQLRQVS